MNVLFVKRGEYSEIVLNICVIEADRIERHGKGRYTDGSGKAITVSINGDAVRRIRDRRS